MSFNPANVILEVASILSNTNADGVSAARLLEIVSLGLSASAAADAAADAASVRIRRLEEENAGLLSQLEASKLRRKTDEAALRMRGDALLQEERENADLRSHLKKTKVRADVAEASLQSREKTLTAVNEVNSDLMAKNQELTETACELQKMNRDSTDSPPPRPEAPPAVAAAARHDRPARACRSRWRPRRRRRRSPSSPRSGASRRPRPRRASARGAAALGRGAGRGAPVHAVPRRKDPPAPRAVAASGPGRRCTRHLHHRPGEPGGRRQPPVRAGLAVVYHVAPQSMIQAGQWAGSCAWHLWLTTAQQQSSPYTFIPKSLAYEPSPR